jgi:hypothetical protein
MRLFDSYQKRNALSNYVQSHGMIGSKLVLAFSEVIKQDTQSSTLKHDEELFWLYVTVMEQVLPLSYYTNMIEAGLVMS